MINYYLRPDGTQVKVDSDNKTITNIVNKDNQKIIGHFTGTDYYNRVSTDAVNLNWPLSDQSAYEASRDIVLQYLSSL